jgi:hypothetical protein
VFAAGAAEAGRCRTRHAANTATSATQQAARSGVATQRLLRAVERILIVRNMLKPPGGFVRMGR